VVLPTEAVTVAAQIEEFDFKFTVFKFLCDIRPKTKCSLIALPDAAASNWFKWEIDAFFVLREISNSVLYFRYCCPLAFFQLRYP
jgi:hypothetical protein